MPPCWRRRPIAGLGLLVTGRISAELAFKAARAGLAWVATPSVPSTLAVVIARRSGMVLVGRAVSGVAARASARGVTPDALRALLQDARTIAVVGLSPNPDRPSHSVARYLQRAGYRIVPVNPFHAAILGERCYPSLSAAARDHTIDIVDVFRRSERAGEVVDEALALRPRLIWLQPGVVDPAAAARAEAAVIPFVMDRCLAVDHQPVPANSSHLEPR